LWYFCYRLCGVLELYNDQEQRFYTLVELDAGFADHDLRSAGRFDYYDHEGTKWLVAVSPCFPTTDAVTGATEEVLTILVFSKWSDLTSTLPALRTSITRTSDSIVFFTCILSAALLAALLLWIVWFVAWLTSPLAKMRAILQQVIVIMVEDERHRDYSDVVNDSWFNLNRNDELGHLSTVFWYMIVQLHNNNVAKRNRPLYPVNPFHIDTVLLLDTCKPRQNNPKSCSSPPLSPPSLPPPEALFAKPTDSSTAITVADFVYLFETLHPDVGCSAMSNTRNPKTVTVQVEAPQQSDNGDILQQILTSIAPVEPSSASATAVVSVDPMDKAELGSAACLPSSAVSLSPPAAAPMISIPSAGSVSAPEPATGTLSLSLPLPHRPTCSSKIFTVRTYLYLLSTVLVAALLTIIVSTVYVLQQEGTYWMEDTGDYIEATEIVNMNTVVRTKAAFIQVKRLQFLKCTLC
jgi:hypothetical protein